MEMLSNFFFFILFIPIATLNPFFWPSFITFTFSAVFWPVGIAITAFILTGLLLYKFKPKKFNIGLTLLVGLAFGSILFWGSMVLSERPISSERMDNTSSYEIIATGGFPWHTMEYPQPPMGNDKVPQAQWAGLRLNAAFWMLIGLIIAGLSHKHIKNWHKSRWLTILVLGVLFHFGGIFQLLLRFD